MTSRVRRASALAVLAMVLASIAGCGVQERACPTALLEGELTTTADADLVVTSAGAVQGMRVMWEPDHDVRVIDGEVVLVDGSGSIVAREGDHISMGGGVGTGSVFRPCGDFVVTPAG